MYSPLSQGKCAIVKIGEADSRRSKQMSYYRQQECPPVDWSQRTSCRHCGPLGVIRLKNRLSTYSIIILLGLSLTTAAIVLHNPFAMNPSTAPHSAGGGSSQSSVSSSSSSAVSTSSTSPGPGLLTGSPSASSPSHSDVGDDGHDASHFNHNGTRVDD